MNDRIQHLLKSIEKTKESVGAVNLGEIKRSINQLYTDKFREDLLYNLLIQMRENFKKPIEKTKYYSIIPGDSDNIFSQVEINVDRYCLKLNFTDLYNQICDISRNCGKNVPRMLFRDFIIKNVISLELKNIFIIAKNDILFDNSIPEHKKLYQCDINTVAEDVIIDLYYINNVRNIKES